jgi:small subunit ribosomal protein S13
VEHPKEIRTIVRIANTDLDGEKSVLRALRMIKGLSHMMSKAVCKVAGIDPRQKLGTLDKQTIEKLEEIMKEPIRFGIPSFFVNRRRDIETGKDMHLIGLDLDVAKKFDVQRHVNLKTYKGWRHMLGQPMPYRPQLGDPFQTVKGFFDNVLVEVEREHLVLGQGARAEDAGIAVELFSLGKEDVIRRGHVVDPLEEMEFRALWICRGLASGRNARDPSQRC